MEAAQGPTVIPSQDTLIADLLSLDLSAPSTGVPTHGLGMDSYQPAPMSSGLDDLLGLGSDGLLGDVGGTTSPPTIQQTQTPAPPTNAPGIFATHTIAPPPPTVPSVGQTLLSTDVPPPAPTTTSASNPFTSLGDLFAGPTLGASSALSGQTGYVAPK
ncbi:unnamed protein product, partial [Gongylonema pulchrum]|uniref:RELA n=1 Tax=Gongylonema pulchrum TaxID=637853 RepID=A0A183DCV0_9BILA